MPVDIKSIDVKDLEKSIRMKQALFTTTYARAK